MRLIGTPHAQVGATDGTCVTVNAVPEACAQCRQFDRWMSRTLAWATGSVSRFKNIMGAILRAHDETLASLCGSCATNPEADVTCACVVERYQLLGLSLNVSHYPVEDCVQLIRSERQITTTCYTECLPGCGANACFRIMDANETTTCWLDECGLLCVPCELITLDPCENPDHLDILTRLLATYQSNTPRRGIATDIVDALVQLFPGSSPAIVTESFGEVVVTIGRQPTLLEYSFLSVLLNAVPVGMGVKLHLVSPCP